MRKIICNFPQLQKACPETVQAFFYVCLSGGLVALSVKRPCNHPGCRVLTDSGRCHDHAAIVKKDLEARKGKTAERGYGSKWRTARAGWLSAYPLCVRCEAVGLITAAVVVDHVVPHKGDKVLFWDRSNWQSLCKACHDAKTASEDGRWG